MLCNLNISLTVTNDGHAIKRNKNKKVKMNRSRLGSNGRAITTKRFSCVVLCGAVTGTGDSVQNPHKQSDLLTGSRLRRRRRSQDP